jgi:hypothetical protein
MRSAYKMLFGKPEGKAQLGRSRRRWKDNIKMDIEYICWKGMYWIDMVHDVDLLVGCCEFSGSIRVW